MTLGELISALEEQSPDAHVVFDFAVTTPTGFGDFRMKPQTGIALRWRPYSYSIEDQAGHFPDMDVAALLDQARAAIGHEYDGWKGWVTVPTEETEVWVANAGDPSHSILDGLTTIYDEVVLLTRVASEDER